MTSTSSINHHTSSSNADFLQHAAERYAARVFTIPDCRRVYAYYRALTTYEELLPAYNPNPSQDVTYIDQLLTSFHHINSITDLEERIDVLTYLDNTITLYLHDPSINPVESFRNVLYPYALFWATHLCSKITLQIFKEILAESIHPFTAEPISSYFEFQETVKILALGFIIGVMKPTERLS